MEILVTGATGGVGAELLATLTDLESVSAVGTSRSGGGRVATWDLVEPPPPALDRHWDVVVHAAASTRWSMSQDEAIAANILPTENLLQAVEADRFIYLSTAHATGWHDSVESSDLADYRNTYEWSKAWCERLVRERPGSIVVRFPIVFGRRSDGAIARYGGMFKVIPAIASGLVPAIVGVGDAPFDLVAVDELCAAIAHVATTGDTPLVRIGCGAVAPTVDQVVDVAIDALNEWRLARGLEPTVRPPLLDPERWHRFLLPFASEHLSPLQQRSIEIFSEFEPYFCMERPFAVDLPLPYAEEAVVNTVLRWADGHPRAASRSQVPWRP